MKSFKRPPTDSPGSHLPQKRRRPAPSASLRRGGSRHALAASIALVGAILLAPAQSHAAIVWNGGVGNWSAAGNWTGGVPNASNADVQVDNGNAVASTVSVDGVFTVGRLTISSGDAVGINNAQQLTLSDAGGLGAIINNGTLSINAGANQTLLAISGNVALSGSGTTVLGGVNALISGAGRLTNSNTINGQGTIGNNTLAVTNLATGLIDANVNGAILTVAPTIVANAFLNQGTLRASNGGILQLSGIFSGTFDNTGGTVSALAGSEVRLVSLVSITGGTFTTTGSGVIDVAAGDNASLGAFANSGSIVVRNNGRLNVSGTITNSGTILIESSNAGTNLTLTGNVTLTGAGTTTLQNFAVIGGSGGVLTNASTIQGSSNNGFGLGASQIGIINQSSGLIDANVAGLSLYVTPNAANGLVNLGTMRASNGGFLVLNGIAGGSFTNTGASITALTGSEVQLINNAPIIGGTLSTVGTGVIRNVSGQAATLTGVTNTGKFIGSNNSTTNVSGTITNSGTILIESSVNVTDLTLAGNVTLTGAGTTTLQNFARIVGSGVLTNASTIQGSSNNGYGIGVNAIGIINQSGGLIDANAAGLSLYVDPNSADGLVNQGTLRASNTGVLILNGIGNGSFTNTGGTITALAGSEVQLINSATVIGGTLSTVGTGVIRNLNSQIATLSGVTNTGTFIGNDNSSTFITGTINNSGTITINAGNNFTDLLLGADTSLTGSGTVTLATTTAASNARVSGTFRLTNVSTIQGEGNLGNNNSVFTNQGTVDANLLGRTLTVDPGNFANAFLNQATLQATNGGFLQLSGNSGGAFDNAGGTIRAVGAGSEVRLTLGVSIANGTLATSGGGIIRNLNSQVATLNGVTNTGTFIGNDNSSTIIVGTINNSGTISIINGNNFTDLILGANASLTGSGAVILASTVGGSFARVSGTFRLTNASTIQGEGNLGNNDSVFTNQGTVDANISGRTLTVDPGNFANAFINQGTLRASNGGILLLTGNGGGGFSSTNGSAISAVGAGSEVQLGGSVTLSNTALSTGGGGIIRNLSGQTAFLTDVTNTGTFIGNDNSSTVIAGTISNSGTIIINAGNNFTDLVLGADTTLTGGGTVTLASTTGGSNARVSGTFRLTNVSTIQGEGNLGNNDSVFTNQGTVDANVSGRTLKVDPGNFANAFINQGTLRASNSGILLLTGNGGGGFSSTNGSAISAVGAGSEVQLGGSVTLTSTVLNTSGGGVIRNLNGQTASLTDVTNTGTFIANDNSSTIIAGTINNSGTIVINAGNNFTDLILGGNTSLTGGGALTLASTAGGSLVRVSGTFRLTNSSTIQGEGNLGNNDSVFTNQGTVNANITGRTLTVDPGPFANALLNDTTGTLRASNGGTVLLSGNGGGSFTNNGTFEALNLSLLTMDASAVLTNNVAGVLTGGTYRAVATGGGATLTIQGIAITRIAANTTVELNGAGSVFQVAAVQLESSLITNNGTLKVLGNRNYTSANAFANGLTAVDIALLQLGGGTFNSLSLINQTGSSIVGFGNITPRPTNFGIIRSNGGLLTFANGIQGGSGTVQIDPGSTLDLSAGGQGSSADFLIHNGTTAGSLNLGTNIFTVTADYTNANFGTGNTFTPRANVSGSGAINAGGNTAQQINGSVTGGTTATPALALPNIHEGGTVTRNFTVANTGNLANSPALRGAIQTAATGHITDARLSVTPQNFGPVAPAAQTGNISVSLSGSTPGALAAGQTVGVLNNFDNVADQIISITGGAVYRFAISGPVTPNPLQLASVREGGTFAATAITASNTVVDFPGFTELLSGVLAGPSGNVVASGSINNLAPGASDSASMTLRLTDTTVGAHSGTVSFNPTSVALAGSGLSNTSLTAQPLTVNGNIYRAAVFTSVAPSPVQLASIREGGTFTALAITVINGATNVAGFTESLSTAFSGAAGNVTAAGSVTGLAPGATDNSAMTVALTNTAAAGAKTGTVNVTGTSNPVAGSGLASLPLTSQPLTVNGSVYRAAVFTTVAPNPVQLAGIHEGGTFTALAIAVNNGATNVANFTESLSTSFSGAAANVSATGSAIGLAPGATNNSAMTVALTNTAVAGAKTGTVNVTGTSNPVAGSGLSNLSLTPQSLTVQGSVFRLAIAAAISANPVQLASIREGGTFAAVPITETNTAVDVPGFTEKLSASFSGGTANVVATGTILNLAPGASDNSSMTVRLNDTTVGAHSGTVPFNPTSVAVAASGLSNSTLAAQTLTVNGNIYRAAVFTAVAPNPVQLANIREGGTFAPVAISVNNGATNFAGFTESLSSAFSGAAANVTAAGSVSTLAPGATNNSSMTVALTGTATAGAKSGTVNVTGTSIPVAGSGLSNLSLTSQSLAVQGNVFRLATASTHTPEPVAFGVRHVGEIVSSQILSVANSAANDGFSERLNGSIGSATGGVTTNGGSFTQLAPGAPANTSLGVGISTVTAGNKNGTATISLLSDGTGTSGLAPLAITSQTVNVTGQVNFFADPLLFFKIGSAVLQQIDATHFKLDFGQVIQNTGSYTASFGVRNVLHDGTFQDTLGGTFNTASVTKFTLAGFTPFSGIASGSAFDPDVTFNTARPQGTYADTLFISPSSANVSGTSGLGTIQLDLGAQVVPEPGSALLLALGGGLFLVRRRRR